MYEERREIQSRQADCCKHPKSMAKARQHAARPSPNAASYSPCAPWPPRASLPSTGELSRTAAPADRCTAAPRPVRAAGSARPPPALTVGLATSGFRTDTTQRFAADLLPRLYYHYFITTTVREQDPRSHHKGATGRVANWRPATQRRSKRAGRRDAWGRQPLRGPPPPGRAASAGAGAVSGVQHCLLHEFCRT